jgi:farnesyl-diphosphate farnesyltransferase
LAEELTFSLTSAQAAYLSAQMNLVSRSFALVVPSVEEPLNHYLGTAYLICRVVDNIEDCDEPYEWQAARFGEFDALLEDPGAATEILARWGAEPWPGLTADERAMMSAEGGARLWEIYGRIPGPSRSAIRRWAGEMAAGMRQVEDPSNDSIMVTRDGVRLPLHEDDYNQYCFFVAGTVGHMVTDLAIERYCLVGDAAEVLVGLSEPFGRGLQKTNIVKDFARDLARRTCYLPDEWLARVDYAPLALAGAPTEWTRNVLADVIGELRDATDYVLALPLTAPGFRRANLLSLFPAYQTILLAAQRHDRLFTADHEVKISRLTMARCIADASALATDNDGVQAYGRSIERAFDDALGADPGATP